MNPVVIIPTFISARRNRSTGGVLSTYDHPTAISQQGELARCLASLRKVRGLGQVVVLVVSEQSIEMQAAEKVQNIVAKFPDLHVAVIAAPEEALIHQRLEQLGLTNIGKQVGLGSYGAVRNLGLVVANVLGFDSVVFLDDDEVIDNEDFLIQGMYGLGKLTKKGIPILAKTGFYYNSEGSYLSRHKDAWYDRFWQQAKAFNEWITSAMRGPRLSRSNHVCGGCLVLHKEAYKRLSFDPWIARGEDLDYMLNLRMYGSDIWFDNQWHLRHLPPESPSEGDRFRQDIYRWLYEYRKMEYSRTQIDLQQVKPSSLAPYPGPFLEPGITRRIRITAWLRSFGRPDKKAYRRAAKAAAGEAATYAQRNCAKYFEMQFVWPELMARVEGDQMLRMALVRSAVQRAEGVVPQGQSASIGYAPASAPSSSAQAETGAGAGMGASLGGGTDAGASDGVNVGNIDPGLTSEIRLNIAE